MTIVTPESHGLALWPRGAVKARRGAPGARFAEIQTAPLRLPRADAPGISPRVHNCTVMGA